MDLSSNLRAIVSQRLIRTADGKGRRAAMEILINTPIIAEKILKGEFHEIKGIMGKSRELGQRIAVEHQTQWNSTRTVDAANGDDGLLISGAIGEIVFLRLSGEQGVARGDFATHHLDLVPVLG